MLAPLRSTVSRVVAPTVIAAAGLVFAAPVAPAFAGTDHGCACTTPTGTQDAAKPSKDIVETAAANGSFGTLLAAATAAGLVETLQSEGPFTVLAPTDAAFAKLPEGTVENLLKPENKQALTDILLYHVVSGAVPSTDVVTLSEFETLQGSMVSVSTADGKVMLNDATVVIADLKTSNGVIHVIDTVLIPEG